MQFEIYPFNSSDNVEEDHWDLGCKTSPCPVIWAQNNTIIASYGDCLLIAVCDEAVMTYQCYDWSEGHTVTANILHAKRNRSYAYIYIFGWKEIEFDIK